jgi:hypothetical protein
MRGLVMSEDIECRVDESAINSVTCIKGKEPISEYQY